MTIECDASVITQYSMKELANCNCKRSKGKRKQMSRCRVRYGVRDVDTARVSAELLLVRVGGSGVKKI